MEPEKRFPLATLVISIGGVLFSLYLMINEWISPPYCPRFLGVPACYLVFAAFVLTAVSTLLPNRMMNRSAFFLGFGIGFTLAVWFSFNHMWEVQHCHELFGIPLCYVSFLVFCNLLGLKLFLIRHGQPESIR